MIALHKSDGAFAFLAPAPSDKLVVQITFIAGQSNPQIEYIPQKYQSVVRLFNGRQHFKKCGMVIAGSADVGISDDDHNNIPALSLKSKTIARNPGPIHRDGHRVVGLVDAGGEYVNA
jgi:hypothetical protein